MKRIVLSLAAVLLVAAVVGLAVAEETPNPAPVDVAKVKKLYAEFLAETQKKLTEQRKDVAKFFATAKKAEARMKSFAKTLQIDQIPFETKAPKLANDRYRITLHSSRGPEVEDDFTIWFNRPPSGSIQNVHFDRLMKCLNGWRDRMLADIP